VYRGASGSVVSVSRAVKASSATTPST
jgi:hypothetical protein